MVASFLILLLLIGTPAWAWTKNYASDPVPGATLYRLEKSTDVGVTWTLAVPDSPTPAFTYTGTEPGLVLFRISAIGGAQITARPFDGLWHNEAWVAHQPPPPAATTVTFDSPIPPGSSGSFLNGVFQGIDFGTNSWRWSGPSGPNTTRSIYFNSNSGTGRSFSFSPGPKIFTGMRVFTAIAGTLTVTDNLGQTKAQVISVGPLQTVTTGWTQASSVVTVSFTSGWVLGVDDLGYR